MAETKSQKFERVGAPRIKRAIEAIKLLGNLKDRRFYEATHARKREIIGEIRAQLETLCRQWGLTAEAVEPSANFPVPPLIPKLPARPQQPKPDDGAERAIVDGRDRIDIRYALRLLQDGHHQKGTQELQKVVVGWPVYSPAEEEANLEAAE